jgi:hypothetical protein
LPNIAASLAKLNARWDQNVLVMGDLNDEPFDRSVFDYLKATKDLDLLEEPLKKAGGRREIPAASSYLERQAYLFNCMWRFLGMPDTGSFYHTGGAENPDPSHTMNLLDQFLISRGLYYGAQGLRMDLESTRMTTPKGMTTNKGRPRPFDRENKKGMSDHFPIEGVIKVL